MKKDNAPKEEVISRAPFPCSKKVFVRSELHDVKIAMREVSLEDTVSVLAVNAWKIGMQTLLEIENENFQTDTQMQRVAIMEEIMAFKVHMLDRIAYDLMGEEERGQLISTFALKLADHIQTNAHS